MYFQCFFQSSIPRIMWYQNLYLLNSHFNTIRLYRFGTKLCKKIFNLFIKSLCVQSFKSLNLDVFRHNGHAANKSLILTFNSFHLLLNNNISFFHEIQLLPSRNIRKFHYKVLLCLHSTFQTQLTFLASC